MINYVLILYLNFLYVEQIQSMNHVKLSIFSQHFQPIGYIP